jgi:hypothetical protein
MRNNIHMEELVTTLCPAGHLPHKGRCHGVTEGGNTRTTEAGPTP